MDGMIERIAKALCEGDGFAWLAKDSNHTANGETPEEQRDYWRDKARSALMEAREPTEEMIDAGRSAEGEGGYSEDIWRAMVDAELSTGGEEP